MATRFASGFNQNLNHDERARSQVSYHSYDYQVVGSDGAMQRYKAFFKLVPACSTLIQGDLCFP